ncbi:MAG: hypothetical protein A2Z50_07240 [Nitrospirae bacterium RBG_19FT_COMBO_42_15]|nr:MAG: hypothetical protein A2Z50_07240 [Nitrospirae bacterium RBG_19FT_COMBO_42_15]
MYKELFSCKGRTAIVTGGAGLIGRGIVKALHEFGAEVYIADIDKNKADELIRDISVKYVYLDIASDDSIQKALAEVIKNSGKIDILVNCAYPRTKDWGMKFENIPFSSWKANLDNHLGGYFLCCQKTAEQMKAKGGGTIINLSSIYGVVAPDFSIYEGTEITMPAAYSAIKGAIISLTRYIATYYGSYNVRANSISPGGIFDNQPKSFVERYTKKTPLKRMGAPDDVIGAVILLASDASSYITGQNILIDGGWTAW